MTVYTIRLSNNSQIYKQFKYPAGEWQVRISDQYADSIELADQVNIIARITSADDIIRLALLADAVNHWNVHLILPYLPYSRADRRFTNGDCHGLNTFGRLIDSMDFGSVTTIDAHNQRAAASVFQNSEFKDLPADGYIDKAIGDFARTYTSDRITVLFPDKGAKERYKSSDELACNTGSIKLNHQYCSKLRDEVTGNFLGFEVPDIPYNDPVIIIDDICDGGGTFIGIAEKLRNGRSFDVPLGLYVTHGIFSRGYNTVAGHFAKVYTTDTIDRPDDHLYTGSSLKVYPISLS